MDYSVRPEPAQEFWTSLEPCKMVENKRVFLEEHRCGPGVLVVHYVGACWDGHRFPTHRAAMLMCPPSPPPRPLTIPPSSPPQDPR